MRTTDERMEAVKRRVNELEQKNRQRKYRYMSLASLAACLVIIVGMGIAMPGIIEGLSKENYSNMGMMASIFYKGNALGYVLIGLLSFALGVCLTILCFILQPKRQKNKERYNYD
jgi:uncharacterized membrane protein